MGNFRMQGSDLFDSSFRKVATVRGNDIQDDKFHKVATIRGNDILNEKFQRVATVRGSDVYDEHGSRIAGMTPMRRVGTIGELYLSDGTILNFFRCPNFPPAPSSACEPTGYGNGITARRWFPPSPIQMYC